ncbi:MAG: outer membrane beta-barrel protein [Gammaproteobacteria bacterium]|jgi:opacity protein-like surface antigen
MRSRHFLLAIPALILFSATVFADCDCDDDDDDDVERSYDYLWEGEFDASLLLGISSISQDDSIIQSDLTETDLLVQNSSNWDSWTGQFGIGYEMPLYWSFGEDDDNYDEDSDISWFDTLTPQINVFIIGGTDLDGNIYTFENPEHQIATYSIDFHSTRLMFDLGLDILTVRNFSFYAIGGLGIAWNTTEFHWNKDPDEPDVKPGFSLEETDTSSFAYEFGGGVDYAASEDIDIALQYLYTVFDDVSVSGLNPNSYFDYEAHSSDFDVKAQSILLGVRITI